MDDVNAGDAGLTAAEVIVALDFPDAARAMEMVDCLAGQCRFFKIGHELFTATGPRIVERIIAGGNDVFLDLKFHDIPNTVRGGVRSAARLGVRLVTVHASGGLAMLHAAAEGAGEGEAAGGPRCGVLAVSVLTSLSRDELAANWGRAPLDVTVEVLRLSAMAASAGLHGVVCSGAEASAIRDRFGARLATLVPGIRPLGGAAQDQSRVVTPGAAVAAGARYLVVGRPVTGAADPVKAYAGIASAVDRP